ncbi:MAG: ABC transporter substrate-binding protein [Thermomicrobiales bacterium]
MTKLVRDHHLNRRSFAKGASASIGAGFILPNLIFGHSAAQTPAPLGVINAKDVQKYSGTTIHLAVQKHTATDAIQALAPNFEQQTGIKVNFEQIPQQQMDQKQRTDLATGTGSYDVIGWFLNPEYVANDWIFSIDDLRQDAGSTDESLLALDDFYGPFLQWNTYKDVLYGLPFYGESMMMYVNSAELTAVGITKAPDTLAELETACKAIKSAGRMSGIALRGSQEGNAAVYPFLAWLYGHGGFWVNQKNGEIGLESAEAIEAVGVWSHFLRDYGPADVASYFWNEVQLSMQQETAAIIMDATNFGPRLEDPKESKVAGKVGFALLPEVLAADGKPRGPEVSHGRFGHPAISYGLSVPKSSKNAQAAWLFIQWATSRDVMLETTKSGLRGDPTRESSLDDPSFAKNYDFGDGQWADVVRVAFGYGMSDYFPTESVTNAQLSDVLGLALSQILTGDKSPKDAFGEAQSKSVDIQKQAGLL